MVRCAERGNISFQEVLREGAEGGIIITEKVPRTVSVWSVGRPFLLESRLIAKRTSATNVTDSEKVFERRYPMARLQMTLTMLDEAKTW